MKKKPAKTAKKPVAAKPAAKKAAPEAKKPESPKRKVGRPTMWTPELEDLVIAAMAETGCQIETAEICGIHNRRIDEHEEADADFRRRIARAREIGYMARAAKAVQAAKTAKDPQRGRLAFDADRWFLSKIDRRFADKQAVELTAPDVAITLNLSGKPKE